MGLNTEISWCDHTMNSRSLGMDLFVAFLTKGQSIFQNKTKIWEVCKWLDVVGAEIPTLGISTMLAREAISYENIEAPSFVFGAKSNSSPFCCFPIFVEMAFLPSPIGKPTRFAHFFPGLKGVFSSLHWWFSGLGIFRKLFLVFLGVRLPKECRYSSLVSLLDFYPSARLALWAFVIPSSYVRIEFINRLPFKAFLAMLKASFGKGAEFLKGYSKAFCRNHSSSFFCNSHSVKLIKNIV